MELKNWHLVVFVILGIIVMTILVLNMQVKKEVAESLSEQYQEGGLDKEKYKQAVSDGKLTNWEAMHLK